MTCAHRIVFYTSIRTKISSVQLQSYPSPKIIFVFWNSHMVINLKTCLDKCSIEYMYYILSIMYQKIGIWFYLNCAMNKLIIQTNVTKFINVHAFTSSFHILIIFILFNSDKSFSNNRFINVFSNIYSSVIFFLKFFSWYYDISHLFQPIDYVVFS